MEAILFDKQAMNRLKVCVIVPTYNNSKTLKRVLDSVAAYTSHIIIVNDGSTDETANILKDYSQLIQIHHPKNAGKGVALRNGFKKAISLNYQHAITIDSDGQHFASDIPNFIKTVENEGSALLIGSRNMSQQGVPNKSSFGNKFSNFWFWFETTIKLEDTQSGYRLYPLVQLPKKYVTTKFEFEIEVIVRSAWKGIPVKNIPIQVLYDPSERVSHFRPFRDFTRISILNTVLVIVALLYIKPRDFFFSIKKKGIQKFFKENILQSNDPPIKKACSIALGVFIGIAPFWGLQSILVLFLAAFLRLNKAISFLFSNISIPPFLPFIIIGSMKMGSLFVKETVKKVANESLTSIISAHLEQYLFGSFALATVAAVTFGGLGYILLIIISTFKNKR
jgi:glycosyltransferase involved in cell wall biosynthesis